MRPIARREPEWQNRLAYSQGHCRGVQCHRLRFGRHRLCIRCIEPIVLYRIVRFDGDGAGAAHWNLYVVGDDCGGDDGDLWRLKMRTDLLINRF
jgi:hypothetical protein